jgi:hypothetical protein
MPNVSKALFNPELMLTMRIHLSAVSGYQLIFRFFATDASTAGSRICRAPGREGRQFFDGHFTR